MNRKIAILTDFSYCSEKAARVGIELFGTENVSYTFIHSIYLRQAGSLLFTNFQKEIKVFAENRIQTFIEKCQADNEALTIDYRIELGTIKQTVNHLVEEAHWDCFVLGSNGSSNSYEKIIGSSASLLLKEVNANMLIVPVVSNEKEIKSASFPLEINLCNLHNYSEKVLNLLNTKLNNLEVFMIHQTNEDKESVKRTINKWLSNTSQSLFSISQFMENGENFENQIMEIVSKQNTHLLILAPHKEKSFWKRIFDHHVSESVIEKSHLPVLILK